MSVATASSDGIAFHGEDGRREGIFAEVVFRFPSLHSELSSPWGMKKKGRKIDRKCLFGGGYHPFPFIAATCEPQWACNPSLTPFNTIAVHTPAPARLVIIDLLLLLFFLPPHPFFVRYNIPSLSGQSRHFLRKHYAAR